MNKRPAAIIAVIFGCAVLALYFWLSSQPPATGIHHMTADFVGCQDKAVVERMQQLASEGDSAAAIKLANKGLTAGSCIRLFRGHPVYVEDVKFGGYTKLRLKGDSVSYWTGSKFVGG